MAYNQQHPFWDWARSFDESGPHADHAHDAEGPSGPPPHPGGGPFAWGPWGPQPHMRGGAPGPCGRRGRNCPRRNRDDPEGRRGSRSRSRSGERNDEDAPRGPPHPHAPHGRHGPRGPWERRRHRGPPPFAWVGPGAAGTFDLNGIFNTLASHPWAQTLRDYAEQNGYAGPPQEAQRSGETAVAAENEENDFKPAIDVFTTEKEYVLHVSLPGAKKEDVGVNWDADKSALNVAGVVYRLGDEEFLKTLSQTERKVGVFERAVRLPPGGQEKEEIDSDGITAKLEDGVLVVIVPKIEKEWTEVKRVDIE